MIAFLGIAGLMVLAAMAVLLWPLLRAAGASTPRWPAAVAVAVLIPGIAFGLYQTWSNWSWSPVADMPGVPPAVAQMVGRLEARLRANPNDINGWLLLGRSYFQLGQYLQAADAYERAYTQSGGESLDAILGLGETLVFAEGRAVTPRSAQLFERAFERAPNDPRALWYSGLAAFQGVGSISRATDGGGWLHSIRHLRSGGCWRARSPSSTRNSVHPAPQQPAQLRMCRS